MTAVAEALNISRSHLSLTTKDQKKRRRKRPTPDDEWLLPLVRHVTDERPSYGYRRVTAMLNRVFDCSNQPRVNHKRVYRIMKENRLLLARFTGKQTDRPHEGKVITLKSNLRWCSDTFQIRCWSGERVEVAFSLDCCDREAMRYVATTSAITGEMVRDLMAETVDFRFPGARRLPHLVEWLTDNGPPYTAHETRSFGASLGFAVCTTPAYSPQSNGMAEAFVKTFKRDYVYLGDVSSAETVFAQLPHWFNDYNENAPHKGLKMQSPRQFRRAANASGLHQQK